MAICIPDLLHLGVIILIIASMLASLGYLMYGYRVLRVSSLLEALATGMTLLTTGDDG